MPLLRKLALAHDEYIEAGHPRSAIAIAQLSNEVRTMRAIVRMWTPDRWESRIAAIADHALPHQTSPLATAALSFSERPSSVPSSEYSKFEAAIPTSQQDDHMRRLTDEVLNAARSYTGQFFDWNRVFYMRENVKVAIPLQENAEVQRWLIASITPSTGPIWAHDGRVLYAPPG